MHKPKLHASVRSSDYRNDPKFDFCYSLLSTSATHATRNFCLRCPAGMQLPLVSLRDAGRLLHRRLLGKVTVQNTVCMKSMPTALLKVVKGKSGANKTFWIHRPAAQGAVIFFGGDQIQDASAPAEVLRLQDPKVQADIMANKFPNQHIVVMVPARLEACFACYDHFLGKCTQSGEPLGYDGSSFKAMLASSLKRGLRLQASSQITSLLQAGLPTTDLATMSYYLVGFSKGGVVLNQVLAEAAELWQQHGRHKTEAAQPAGPLNKLMQGASHYDFLQNIREVHYLDVGLNCRGAHLTDPQVLHALSSFARSLPQPLAITLHGTPRQWEDKRRLFVRQEKDRFRETLQQAGLPVPETQYFTGHAPSLLMHVEAIHAMQRAGLA